jgi:hypothetical protein
MGRDSGCRTDCPEFLRGQQTQYRFALVLFDLEGSGRDHQSRALVEASLARRVGLSRCTDPALAKLVSVLQQWFPPV